MNDKYWKHVGPYQLPPEGKWINESVKVAGLHGASLIREAEDGAPAFLVLNGQMFIAVPCDE